MLKKILTSKRGEMYIEGIITIIVVFALLAFSLSVLQIATLSTTADHIADQLIETATFYGSFGSEYNKLKKELEQTYSGISFKVSEVAPDGYYNSSPIYKSVQLGDAMQVTVTYYFSFMGLKDAIELHTVRSGASEKYWKTT